jgi:pSer/pThr/pTyr-binding forkhead associated (FHA) protein
MTESAKKPLDMPHHTPPSITEVPLVETKQVPLDIQYGPTLRRFKKMPVTIGRGPHCDVMMNYPAIHDLHAQIFFSQNQYWIKDLTGQNRVSVDGVPLQQPAPLTAESRVSLSPQGPTFRFLEGGRLAEIEDVNVADSGPSSPPPGNEATGQKKAVKPPNVGGIIKKFLKS